MLGGEGEHPKQPHHRLHSRGLWVGAAWCTLGVRVPVVVPVTPLVLVGAPVLFVELLPFVNRLRMLRSMVTAEKG